MATGNLIKNISDEATCSLCLEYFKDPVTVDCGHNFCQTCIAQCLEKAEAEPSCPQCRETISLRNFRPICGKHQEPLKLFCKEDRMCICLVCLLSKEHKDHNLVLLEEASQEYKVRHLCGRWVARLPEPIKEKQKCLSAFEKLQEALEENKCVWMSWLDDLQKKKEEYWKENDIELLDKITDLSSQIAEMEKKWQQPAGEFLQVRH
uniref:RING-type E3 ubiquitin transferase n=1 Tax=Salvator merianae TaxID=96440 RepID=A0A8D0BPL9_SALMN